jgi:hypothetical protein
VPQLPNGTEQTEQDQTKQDQLNKIKLNKSGALSTSKGTKAGSRRRRKRQRFCIIK